MTNVILIILFAVLDLFGSGGDLNQKVAESLKSQLGEKVGDVKADVKEATGTRFTSQRTVSSIDLTMTSLYAKPVTFSTASIHVEDMSIGYRQTPTGRQPRIDGVGKMVWHAEITQEEMSKALSSQSHNVRSPEFRFTPNGVSLDGLFKLGPLQLPFSVGGTLVLSEDKKRIDLSLDRASFVGLGLSRPTLDKIQQDFNPIIDIDKLGEKKAEQIAEAEKLTSRKLNPLITKIVMGDGVLTADGSV
jgi:hypothetical protein